MTLNQRVVGSSPTGGTRLIDEGSPMHVEKGYVRKDEHGVLRVAETPVMLASVVAAFHLGHSAEIDFLRV
jgi:hypothetical protein